MEREPTAKCRASPRPAPSLLAGTQLQVQSTDCRLTAPLVGIRGFRQLGRSLPSDARRYQSMVGFVSLLLLAQFRLLQCDGISSCGPLAPGPLYFTLAKTTADPQAAHTRMDRIVTRCNLSRAGSPVCR